MRARKLAAAATMISSLLLPAAAPAQPKAELLAACAACHGPGGNSPTPQIPSLAGQPKVFVETQLVLIREGLREIAAMKEAMAGISDETIVALAGYYAAQPPAARRVPVNEDRYRRGEQTAKRMLCGTCHLPDYSGQQQVPRLAGQHEEYLLAAMKQLRDNPGPGRDTIMAASLRGLTDADLAGLAHYLAAFKP